MWLSQLPVHDVARTGVQHGAAALGLLVGTCRRIRTVSDLQRLQKLLDHVDPFWGTTHLQLVTSESPVLCASIRPGPDGRSVLVRSRIGATELTGAAVVLSRFDPPAVTSHFL